MGPVHGFARRLRPCSQSETGGGGYERGRHYHDEHQSQAAWVASAGAKQPGDVAVRAILTVRDPIEETTANLLAPVVLNPTTRLGRQVVLQDSDYPIRAAIFSSLEAVAESRPAQAA